MSAASAVAATATLAQRNAANAQHSAGPVTAEGKARSARNSIRHGLTSRTVVLAHESQADYDELRAALFDEYNPGSPVEEELLARMVDCFWRLKRAFRVEAEYYDQRTSAIAESTPDLTGDAALATMFVDGAESKSYRLFLRYLTNAQNSWNRACAEYQQTRKARLQRELESSMLDAMLEARRNEYELEEEEEEEGEVPQDEEFEKEPEPEAWQPAANANEANQQSGFVSHRSVVADEPHPFPGLPRVHKPSEKAA